MNFKDIFGQKTIINRLRASIRDDMAGHAYIFSGPKGIGKKTMANVFANGLLCTSPENSEPCLKCMPCQMFREKSNPDFFVISSEGPSISVEEIRNLQSDIYLRPIYSKRKIYLIQDAHKMTVQAQNCLLKTLEEPPSYVTIILTAANYDTLLETIKSRAINYAFQRNTIDEVKKYVELNYTGEELISDRIDFISQYSNGVIGTALELIESKEFMDIRQKVFQFIGGFPFKNKYSVFEWYKFFDDNKENTETILDLLIFIYRDILICRLSGQNMLINSDKKDIILNSMKFFNDKSLHRNIKVIEETRRKLKQNTNFQLTIEVMLLSLQED